MLKFKVVGRNIPKWQKELRALGKLDKVVRVKTLHERVGELLVKQLLDNMAQEKHGRVYYSPALKRSYTASAPGEAPAIVTGNLASSTMFTARGDTLEVGYQAEYGKFLEEGTKRMAKRPNIITLGKTAFPLYQTFIDNELASLGLTKR